jgi:predicted KAP-like P-loop ATPase
MWNDKETSVDLLGNDKIAQTIIEIIKDNHLRPLTIGIFGDWGVGKSSILSLLQLKVKLERASDISNSYCILFNGWLFQGYEDAKTALMETVVAELAKLQPRNKKIQGLAKSLAKRINWLKVAKVSSAAALTIFTGLPPVGLVGSLQDIYKKGKELTGNGDAENKDGDDKESFLNEAEEESVTQQIHLFRKEFEELIKKSKVDHVVVMVDDLDRCLPKAIIEILEAIRLFLFVEGTTFVLSADEKMIEYAVREHFPNLPVDYQDYTKNYLEKLIQIPIRIPLLNRAQTGNYIKLLMLQFYLNHDYEQLQKVYEQFNKQKKRPYEAKDLSYELISKTIESDAVELKETLLVADQLTPTLAIGLKGNPRNIKRFMNTLFLRMKVARIYGLDDIIKLNVLAKLMLLERFQTKHFEKLVAEVSSSLDGLSKTIKDDEKELSESINKENSSDNTEAKDANWLAWLSIEPALSNEDLRPYIFISKEKAIGFETDTLLPENLHRLLQMLSSHASISLNKAEKDLLDIAPKDRIVLFDKLEIESRSASEYNNIPPAIEGLLRIINVDQSLELRLVSLMESFPSTGLGSWAVTEFSGLKSPEAKAKFKQLLQKWERQNQNNRLKQIASQFLKQNQ